MGAWGVGSGGLEAGSSYLSALMRPSTRRAHLLHLGSGTDSEMRHKVNIYSAAFEQSYIFSLSGDFVEYFQECLISSRSPPPAGPRCLVLGAGHDEIRVKVKISSQPCVLNWPLFMKLREIYFE